ncbi:metaxin-1-like isoform X2 [Dysidea avara]|uniref:metaxin-1-like isoform X2 n=1 Tax=Dysidea avara TaxID=196820 RepID=UPI0033169A46
MELLIHSGDDYVASFEPESLAALTYTKLAEIPVTVTSACVPWRTPSGQYPVLKHDARVVHDDVLDYFSSHGYDLDGALTAKQAAESFAYKTLVRDALHKALLYCRWLDAENYSSFTRKWYSNQLSFPLTIFLPHMKHRSVQSKLENECTPDLTPDMFHNLVLARARECFNTLSVKLDTQQYFFGDKPTSLDAVVYGYLDNLIQYSLPGNNSLQGHVYCCDNLLQFCTRVRSRLYPDHKTGTSSEAEVSNWQPAMWISIGTAASLLLFQMYRVGWFHKPPIPDTNKTSLENYVLQ